MGVEHDARLAELAGALALLVVLAIHHHQPHVLQIEFPAVGLAVGAAVRWPALATLTIAIASPLKMDVVI